MEADSGLSDTELKQKYKKLAVKYHPDKNKDCVDCKERFARILKAWEILGNPEKRQAYDTNNGIITKIKSKSITLTHQNYYEEVIKIIGLFEQKQIAELSLKDMSSTGIGNS